MLTIFTITGLVNDDREQPLAHVTVRAYDRDLRSAEFLGEAVSDGDGAFRIEYSAAQFRRAEKDKADLVVRVFARDEREYTIIYLSVNGKKQDPPTRTLFNVPDKAELQILVAPLAMPDVSEYEQIVAAVTPLLDGVALDQLTPEDVDFLSADLDMPDKPALFLRIAHVLAGQTGVAAEAFYAWLRVPFPGDWFDLQILTDGAKWEQAPTTILDALRSGTDGDLVGMLQTQAEKRIVPAWVGERAEELVRLLKRSGQQAYPLVLRLLDGSTQVPLAFVTVEAGAVAPDTVSIAPENAVTGPTGRLELFRYAPPGSDAATVTEISLQIRRAPDGDVIATTQVDATLEQAGPIELRLDMPAPSTPSLAELHEQAGVSLPESLHAALQARQILTLADVRHAGGLQGLVDLPEVDPDLVNRIDSLADLDRLTSDPGISTILLERSFGNVQQIADTPRPEFIARVKDVTPALDEATAIGLHEAARAQTALLHNILAAQVVNQANGFKPLDAQAPLPADALPRRPCGCKDCEAALSPAAYLAELLDYTLKNVRNDGQPMDLAFLERHYHQPFGDLPTDCDSVGRRVRQVRLAVEVLRAHLGERPLAEPAREKALADTERAYLVAAYAGLLAAIGTSYDELRRAALAEADERAALAERLGIALTPDAAQSPRNDELDQLLIAPDRLDEAALERLFGLVDTTRDPLSDGVKLDDDPAQPRITRWNLRGVRWSRDTDAQGVIYGRLSSSNAGARVDFYRDPDRTQLIAAGVNSTGDGEVRITPQGDGELSGVIATAGADPAAHDFRIVAVPALLGWQLAYLRGQWLAQDHPHDEYRATTAPRLPVIDPDLIGPDDFQDPSSLAFGLWIARRRVVDGWLADLAGKQTAQEQQTALQQTLGPDHAILTQISGTLVDVTATHEQREAARRALMDYGLSPEALALLLAADGRTQKGETLASQEWADASAILVQLQKVRDRYPAWIAEEDQFTESTHERLLSPKTFLPALSEPGEGAWPPSIDAKQPLIDPEEIKQGDLPDGAIGDAARALWESRQAQMKQVREELRRKRTEDGVDAMLAMALNTPTQPDQLLNAIEQNLADPDAAVVDQAQAALRERHHLSVEEFQRLMAIRRQALGDANQVSAASWDTLVTIAAGAFKRRELYADWRRELYADWRQEEADQGLVVEYWRALKARLPRWRASVERRQSWQAALTARSQPPIIDPTIVTPDDLLDPSPAAPAFRLWQQRTAQLARWRGELADQRGAQPNSDGLNEMLQTALGISGAAIGELEAQQRAGHSIAGRLTQLTLTPRTFARISKLWQTLVRDDDSQVLDSEWQDLIEILVDARRQRSFADWRHEEEEEQISLSPDFFRARAPQVPGDGNTIPFTAWSARRAWEDLLVQRVEQERSTIEAIEATVSRVEEQMLASLRGALVDASDAVGAGTESRAAWLAKRLLIDLQDDGCRMTTRIEQAMETIQGLLWRLRSGTLPSLRDWPTLDPGTKNRPGSPVVSAFVIALSDIALAMVGEDGAIHATYAGLIGAGPWLQVGDGEGLPAPADARLSMCTHPNGREVFLFTVNAEGNIGYARAVMGGAWSTWAVIGDLVVPTNARISTAALGSTQLIQIAVATSDGVLHSTWWDGAWHDWFAVPGDSVRVDAAAQISLVGTANTAHAFALDSEQRIVRTSLSAGNADPWQPVGPTGGPFAAPGASIAALGTPSGDAEIVLYMIAAGGEVYHSGWQEMTDTWKPWSRAGMSAMPQPATLLLVGDVLQPQPFVAAADGAIHELSGDNWQPIGDTIFNAGVSASAAADGSGRVYLYAVKGRQILGVTSAAPDQLWNLAGINLRLVADNATFDDAWHWLGPYASWRAAMFVYLYPENLLAPDMRRGRQTPWFDESMMAQMTPDDACKAAAEYANYFKDINRLEIEATCQMSTPKLSRHVCNYHQEDELHEVLHMFGRATSGRIYWSSFDPEAQDGFTQAPWRSIPGFENVSVTRIVAALPYVLSNSERSGTLGALQMPFFEIHVSRRQIFLVVEFVELTGKGLGFTTCDLDKVGEDGFWSEHFKRLNLDGLADLTDLQVVGVQADDLTISPQLVLLNEREGSLYRRALDTLGGGWANSQETRSDWSEHRWPFVEVLMDKGIGQVIGDFRMFDPISGEEKPRFGGIQHLHAVLRTANAYWIVYTSNAFGLRIQAEGVGSRPKFIGSSALQGQWSGSVTGGVPTYYRLLAKQGDTIFVATYLAQVKPSVSLGLIGGLSHLPADLTIVQKNTPKFSGVLSMFAQQQSYSVTKFGELEAGKPTSMPADMAVLAVHAGGAQAGRQALVCRSSDNNHDAYCIRYREDNGQFLIQSRHRAHPRLSVPLNVPGKSVSQGHHRQIADAVARHSDATPAVLASLREAYFFVPVRLALQLQRSGYYLEALDWFRTVYDYTAKPGERNISFVLDEDAKSPEQTLLAHGADWLHDPLDPHRIAASRRYAYTRFTIMAIVRCLLDYADAEFSTDTGESLARARALYQTALDLLDVPELRQNLQGCDALAAELRVMLGAAAPPEAQPGVGVLVDKLTQGVSLSGIDRGTIVKRISGVLDQAWPWAEQVRQIQAIAQEARDEAQGSAPIGSAVEAKAVQFTAASRALLTHQRIDLAVQIVGAGAAPRPAPPAPQPGVEPILPAPQPPVGLPAFTFCVPPNPAIRALRLRAEANLAKLRTCRNIAGMKRELDPYGAPTDASSGMPMIGAGGQITLPGVRSAQPTLYRYAVLIERAKQLVQLAAQIEAPMLASLEKRDAEAYTLLRARQELGLAQAQVTLQQLRVSEAQSGVGLAQLQRRRSQVQNDTYASWISAGELDLEKEAKQAYEEAARAQLLSADISSVFQAVGTYTSTGNIAGQMASLSPSLLLGAAAAFVGGAVIAAQQYAVLKQNELTRRAISNSLKAQLASINAAIELRKQDWQLQQALAQQDVAIAEQQITIAKQHVDVVRQEQQIAGLQVSNAKEAIEFLSSKFINRDLYDWMAGVLEGVYRTFLQQATAMAKLAEAQLAFERQEAPLAQIKAGYWAVSSGNTLQTTGGNAPDRRGLTGSARLLQDIYQLDQYAFDTDKRKLQIARTISLAQLAPFEFQRFRETGVLRFATPMELFDRDFPGHYLRLIRRVRTSVIALIPPIEGIRATLSTGGISRVVVGNMGNFQQTTIRRDPETVALSAPIGATGLFELEQQPGAMYLPFENNGVDTSWEFRLPKAANPFDFRTIADILITIEYTALNSFDYRQQVIQQLTPTVRADRAFSLRNQFPDAWYDLHNPELLEDSQRMRVSLPISRDDFPPNLDQIHIKQVLMYVVRAEGMVEEVTVERLSLTQPGLPNGAGGGGTTIDGVISTRRGNGSAWTAMVGKVPFGTWEIALPNTEQTIGWFKDEQIEDILLVISYSGRSPAWPGLDS